MKAKEYAAKIVQISEEARIHALTNMKTATPEEYKDYLVKAMVNSALDAAMDLFDEIMTASKLVKTEESKIGKWREGISKWKSVVNQVHDKIIMHPVTVNYLGLLIAEENPDRFEILVQNKCFLGYELSVPEQAILHKLQDKRMREERERRVTETNQQRANTLDLFAAIFMANLRSHPNNPNNPINM